MTNPTATEIFEMSERFGIEVDDLRAPLDEEERSRIEVEDKDVYKRQHICQKKQPSTV